VALWRYDEAGELEGKVHLSKVALVCKRNSRIDQGDDRLGVSLPHIAVDMHSLQFFILIFRIIINRGRLYNRYLVQRRERLRWSTWCFLFVDNGIIIIAATAAAAPAATSAETLQWRGLLKNEKC